MDKVTMQTEITIIGTVHRDTDKYTTEALSEILTNVNPNVILMEYDHSFFDQSYELKITSDSTENNAIKQFRLNNKIPIRPFDIEGRNKYYRDNDYFAKWDQLYDKIYELEENNLLNPASLYRRDLDQKVGSIKFVWAFETPFMINSRLGDQLVKVSNESMLEGTKIIIDNTPQLAEFKEFWDLVTDEWHRRNQAMVENILKWSQEFADKRIVVLVGAEHRWYLRELLLDKQVEHKFLLKEYYDY